MRAPRIEPYPVPPAIVGKIDPSHEGKYVCVVVSSTDAGVPERLG
jgi:hypothetical protein